MTTDTCPKCEKVLALCICEFLRALPTQLHILILQHPQEPDKELGSARLAQLSLPNSTLKIGLSWPNIHKALGREVVASRWAVLYLGSGVKKSGQSEAGAETTGKPKTLQLVSKQGQAIPGGLLQATKELEGIVILDGTWSQAKALWWRNAWLLKLKRAILTPTRPSLYRELRKEPRRECLSTIESIAEALEALGESPETAKSLRELFAKLLDRKRDQRRPRKVL